MKTTEQELTEHLRQWGKLDWPFSTDELARESIRWLCRRLDEMKAALAQVLQPSGLDVLAGEKLHAYTHLWLGIDALPGETDEQLRARCRAAWVHKENP